MAPVQYMTSPWRYFFRMLIFLAALSVGLAAVWYFQSDLLWSAFNNNAVLNGAIIGIFILGVAFVLREVLRLGVDVAWMNNYAQGYRATDMKPPRLLAHMAAMVNGRLDRGQPGPIHLSNSVARSVLDGIASRQGEARDIARYIVGLLIFLGLLGTFWGLLATVNAVGDVIGQLNPRTGDLSILFGDLTAGLRAPLDGMGTAFSTSLFGMAASLLLGFLDLQAGQAQNRFYNDLEEWLGANAGQSDPEIIDAAGAQGQEMPAYVNALLRKSAESLDQIRGAVAGQHDAQQKSNQAVLALSGQLSTLIDQMRIEQELLMRLAENQIAVTPALERLAKISEGGIDEATRSHIRNTDIHMARLVEDLASSRDHLIAELREEIRLVARTIAVVAESDEPVSEPRSEPLRESSSLRRAR